MTALTEDDVAGMQLEEAFRVLYEVETAKGSKAKRLLLEAAIDNEVLRDLCFAAYGGDMFNAYPTAKFDDVTAHYPFKSHEEAGKRHAEFRTMLVQLCRREVTGGAAVYLVDSFIERCSQVEKKWYRRVLEHDLKVGCNSTFSKVWDFKTLTLDGTTRPESDIIFPGVMRCEKDHEKHIKKWDLSQGILVEPKMDGLRLLFVWAGGDRWSFFSRGGKSKGYNENLGHIAASLITGMKRCNMTSGSIDGEIMGVGWNDTMVVKRKNKTSEHEEQLGNVNFHIFDHLVSTNGRDDRFQRERRRTLELIAEHVPEGSKIILTPQHLVSTLEDALPLYKMYVRLKYEGVIIKSPFATYNGERNKASKQWLKWKPVDTQDVRVIDVYPGRERTKNEGRLGGWKVTNQSGQVFNVGGGINDDQRKEYEELGHEAYRNKTVGRWMEIEYQKDDVAKGRFSEHIRWREDLEE